MKRILALLVLLASVVVVPSAFAGRCAETGDCGTGTSSGGGGGYTQRDSGLWVPNRDGYIQQRSAPIVTPAVERFGQDVVRDVAKDAVKGVGYAAIGAVFSNVKEQLFSSVHTLTLTGWSYR